MMQSTNKMDLMPVKQIREGNEMSTFCSGAAEDGEGFTAAGEVTVQGTEGRAIVGWSRGGALAASGRRQQLGGRRRP